MKKLIKGIWQYFPRFSIKFRKGDASLIGREFRHARQRMFRGFDDSDTYSLYTTTSQWLLPRLERFREIECGTPGEFKNREEWGAVLDKMILAFKQMAYDDYSKENDAEIAEGLKLFAKYFKCLWW